MSLFHLMVDDPSGLRDVPLKERTDRVNAWGSNIHISVHANAAGDGWSDAHGLEGFVYKKIYSESVQLANRVLSSLASATGLTNRGVKEGDLHMVRETKMTAILVEGPFMSNHQEAELLKSDDFRRKYAVALVNGIVHQYGLKRRDPAPSIASPVQDCNTFRIKVIAKELWYYDKPDWNAKKATVKSGEVFTVVETLTELKSCTYITANPKYVQII